MRTALEKKSNKYRECSYRHGYSLVELLVAMAITLVVMAGVYKVYVTQQDSYLLQEQVAEMQQNARTAKYVLVKDIRMVGYNPKRKLNVGNFVTSFVPRLPGDGLDDADPDRTSTGFSSIAFTLDDNGDGVLDANFDEQIAFRVAGESLQRFDVDNNAWLTVVENIEALGFAYAFDADGDGNIDTHPDHPEYIIWAVDSDGGGTLDKNLDTNDDGLIDAADSKDGVALPVEVAPTGEVALDKIRAVRIWILAKTANEERGHSDTSTYVLANQRVPANDGNRRYLVTTTVKCRNMSL